jgi:predicted DNA binding CopG/RHH family protein
LPYRTPQPVIPAKAGTQLFFKSICAKPCLDDEERELIEALDSETAVFKSVMTPASRKAVVKAAHAAMNSEREKITLRISRRDLSRLKSRALQEGMPYQTLINSILHKAAS